MNFIKKIFYGKDDDSVHRQFIRFGKGEYGRRAVLSLRKTKNAKVKGSFEFANDFVLLAANLGNIRFSGNIWSKNEIHGFTGKKKSGIWTYDVKNIESEKIKELSDKIYYFLLNGDSEGINLKVKGKLPKPGKSEDKIDDKFCQIELDERYYPLLKNDFFWDLPEGKKISVEHKFIIKDIVMPKTNEKDFSRIREMAKRKGKIIRTANIDGREVKSEKDFEA